MTSLEYFRTFGTEKADELLKMLPSGTTHLRLWNDGAATPLKGGHQNPRYWADGRWWYANHWYPDCTVIEFKQVTQHN